LTQYAAPADDSGRCGQLYTRQHRRNGGADERVRADPGAGGAAWYWHRVLPELRARGHEAIAVDLPGAEESAGLPEYADAVVAAIDGRRDVVVAAQSMGGFTTPMVCARTPVRLLVLVNAMVPLPGETAGDWWGNTGWEPARIAAAQAGGYPAEFDLATYFLRDVPTEVAAASAAHAYIEADIAFGQPCAIDRWPDVPTRVLAGRDDRFFPLEFQRRIARDRLGLDAGVVPGGHLAALSYPAELADRLVRYLDEATAA
jgi:pimeloyl-ACP methyl ester carboxylesterase